MNSSDYYPYMCGRLEENLRTLLERTNEYKPNGRLKQIELNSTRKTARQLLAEMETAE